MAQPAAGEASEPGSASEQRVAALGGSARSGGGPGRQGEAAASGAERAPDGGFVNLALPGAYPALAWLPEGAGPHRVVVATHGAGGSAEEACEYWRALTEGAQVVLCPRGRPLVRSEPERGFYYPDHLALEREVLAARAALLAAYGQELEDRGWLYAGYSQGATMGALMLAPHGVPFARLALLEGGTEGWTRARAREYRAAGGRRVLLVCGTERCAEQARRAVSALVAEAVEAEVWHEVGAGHTTLGAVEARVAARLPWLLGPTMD
jgi:predicted esterase